MNFDLYVIKRKYGENMSHLCRTLFPTILEKEGLLSTCMLDNFHNSHYLYIDIIKNNLEDKFRDYIYDLVSFNSDIVDTKKTPKELLSEAGYDLFECTSEEEIQSFRKYYKREEEICTFNGNRLDKSYVFFAVKKNVEEIKREKFLNPTRQDEYGTSVISIQFTKDDSHTLLITNRYNHKVENPDATFSNNLDNIILGLTKSFEDYYGMKQKKLGNRFEIDGYIKAKDNKYYKYNYVINNVYYCCDNIIIDNLEVKEFDKSRYLIIDYFIIDLMEKKIRLYDRNIGDSFVNCISDIERIIIKNGNYGKYIKVINKSNEILEIYVDVLNRIIRLDSADIKEVGNWFLFNNRTLMEFNFINLKEVGNDFLSHNEVITKLNLPNLKVIKYCFLYKNKVLEYFYHDLEIVGDYSLFSHPNKNDILFNKNIKRKVKKI